MNSIGTQRANGKQPTNVSSATNFFDEVSRFAERQDEAELQ
jgi:hypothetical protein